MSAPILSILLPTISTRASQFARLEVHVRAQSEGKPVEILSECDNKEISIGKKRQQLLERATGEWVVFIDDDDWVSDTYVDDILAALATGPDCVGFLIRCTTNGRNQRMAKASLQYREWNENVDGYAHVRSPYQKTPVRRNIALLVGFPDLRYAEDRQYSRGLVKHLKTEVFIDKILYEYRYVHEKFSTKYGFTRAGAARAMNRGRRDYRGRPVA